MKMTRHYWTWPIAIYLFLGGLGGGMLFLVFVLDKLMIGGTLTSALTGSYFSLIGASSVEMLGIVVALVALAAGTFLLVFELGQPQLFVRAFITKKSVIKWGAVLLSIALIGGVFWWTALTPWEWLHWTPWYGNTLFADVMEAVAGCAGFGIMVYTGILLSSMKSRPFWNSPALPLLFVTSALSTACAALSLCAGSTWTYFTTAEFADPLYAVMLSGSTEEIAALTPTILELMKEYTVHYLHLIDIVLVFVELLIIFLYLALMTASGNQVANSVAKRWLIGSWAPLFWGCMVFLGLVCPFAMYLIGGTLAEFVAPLLILASGCLLRFMIVYSEDRRAVPGEETYYSRLPSHDAAFITKDWTKTAWYQG